ncbi:MAG: type III polyketide synthase, partial [Desulfuromonadales bacterium]|nr:type III polyketide synthase [Desulfuromonadales bacterium]NIR34230.1 type III polyketide synthase [Desulfuromonadales bacterium]NIS44181.1 type III polyketide synthase [Desulfuromonadales bacterium]
KTFEIFANSRIEQRHFMRPLEWYLDAPGRAAANRIYQTEGLDLLVEAARLCLDKAQSAASSIDHVIFVSTTGMAAPSRD